MCRWLGLPALLSIPLSGAAQEPPSLLLNGDFEQGAEAGVPCWSLQVWPEADRVERRAGAFQRPCPDGPMGPAHQCAAAPGWNLRRWWHALLRDTRFFDLARRHMGFRVLV